MHFKKIAGTAMMALGLAVLVSATSKVVMATVTNTVCTPAYVTQPGSGGTCTPVVATMSCTNVSCNGQRSATAVPGNCNQPQTGSNCVMGTGVLQVATWVYSCGAYPGCGCTGFINIVTPVQVPNC
jgi:hypothetical protein